MFVLLKIFGLILLTDLITGTVHWWEDAYGNPNWKVLGKLVVIPNLEHHEKPRKFLKDSSWSRIRLSLIIATILLAGAYFLNVLVWEVVFVLIYASFANELHAISHRTKKENGRLIGWLQWIGLIQSKRMHGLHHTSPYNVNYCVMTCYLNPMLNKLGYWEKIERFFLLFGIFLLCLAGWSAHKQKNQE